MASASSCKPSNATLSGCAKFPLSDGQRTFGAAATDVEAVAIRTPGVAANKPSPHESWLASLPGSSFNNCNNPRRFEGSSATSAHALWRGVDNRMSYKRRSKSPNEGSKSSLSFTRTECSTAFVNASRSNAWLSCKSDSRSQRTTTFQSCAEKRMLRRSTVSRPATSGSPGNNRVMAKRPPGSNRPATEGC